MANTLEGVHIRVNRDEKEIQQLVKDIEERCPAQSLITSISYEEIDFQVFKEFSILDSDAEGAPDLLITPDFAICEDCKAELKDPNDRRYHYPYITCTSCGPRFSIETGLPYDRHMTSMESFTMCVECEREFWTTEDKRFYSQTNSCPECKISQWVVDANGHQQDMAEGEIVDFICDKLLTGSVVAVKGIGGFLLLCDAANEQKVMELREKKQRPSKPFALLYPSIELVDDLMEVSETEREQLQSPEAPIVLLKPKKGGKAEAFLPHIAPELDRLGVMLPYAPLLVLISEQLNRPLLATSGNQKGSPIIFQNKEAVETLSNFADFLLLNNRDIQIPQDDSVIKYTDTHQQRVVIRRSRGLAPGFVQEAVDPQFDKSVLAMGALLKSTISFWQGGRCHVSQFLGDTTEFDSQLSYEKTLKHFHSLLKFNPEVILVDRHPAYFSSQLGKELGRKYQSTVKEMLHHETHFWSVLGENNLLDSNDAVLGVVFDGTGMGNDGAIWGGEFFEFAGGSLSRLNHICYYPHILGDKMAREPRLSSYSLVHTYEMDHGLIKDNFTEEEFEYYEKVLEHSTLKTSSMGRIFDAVASLLGLCQLNSFEGEAAMHLETLARSYCDSAGEFPDPYGFAMTMNGIDFRDTFSAIVFDLEDGKNKALMAAMFHSTVVATIENMAESSGVSSLAFSGGVFQNGLLVDMIIDKLADRFKLYFHKNLSPNDECISYGQLVGYYFRESRKRNKKNVIHSTASI